MKITPEKMKLSVIRGFDEDHAGENEDHQRIRHDTPKMTNMTSEKPKRVRVAGFRQ